ncbi:MAG: hypothetical protein HGA45_12015 [Chloroflexales bacterium]|nr:hypothetical protein [Chloroflexales bacterium]
MIYEATIEGVLVRTGDIICTANGVEAGVLGRLWQALGSIVPGEIDHAVLYLGPGGRCVEAGARGVIVFAMPEGRWAAEEALAERWILDTFVGVADPLASRGLPPEEERRVRVEVARYCEAQAGAGKPYNVNFFDPETDAAFYCSQLIYKAYLASGVDLALGPGASLNHGEATIVLPQHLWQNSARRRAGGDQGTPLGELRG